MRWAFVAAMCMMVAMCGQKGPLYLPEEPSAGGSSRPLTRKEVMEVLPPSLATYFHGSKHRSSHVQSNRQRTPR